MSYHVESPRSGFKELPDRILVREDGAYGASKEHGEPIIDHWYVPEQDAPQVKATEELRRLLDEHGVEWDYGITGATTTKFSVNGIDLTFTPMRDGLVCSTILTPEQAIEVTLGRGTCHVEGYDDGEDEILDGTWVYREPTWHLSCGHEVHGTHRPCFCPRCGRRIKEV